MYVKDHIADRFGGQLRSTFGEKNGRALSHALAGSVIGVGEVALLPLDALKIKAQTNPDALRGRGVLNIFMSEGTSLCVKHALGY